MVRQLEFKPQRSATEFLSTLPKEGGASREDLIYQEFKYGNCPSFMNWVEVPVGANASIFVLPDYLCVGTEDDYVIIPMWPTVAQDIADYYDAILPTRKIVNDIWKAGEIKLTPQPWGPPYDHDMERTYRWAEHNKRIETQKKLKYQDDPLGSLVVGHKKDIVISAKMQNPSPTVWIYGWHKLTGQPIQGLNGTSHMVKYSDYSHGCRLVSKTMMIDGSFESIQEVLKDPKRCSLVSDEGPLKYTLYGR